MAMGHVVLKEFFVDRQTPYFTDYVKTLHRPAVPGPPRRGATTATYVAGQVPHRRRPGRARGASENAAFKTVLLDAATGEPVVPERLPRVTATATPASAGGTSTSATSTRSCRCSTTATRVGRWSDCRASTPPTAPPADLPRGVPVRRRRGPPGHHRLRPAARPVRRRPRTGCPGEWPTGYDDADVAVHPGLAGADHRRPGRRPPPGSAGSSPQNAEESQGRSMIVMGAGTNHWFHSDTIYRAFLTLTTLTGCQGVNGGGWAHYVGQEKVRPLTGYTQIANALDWNRPPRNMIQTAYWYLHTDQFRYDQFGADTLVGHHRHGPARRQVHRRRDRPERPDGLDAVVPDVRPQPARPRRRGGGRRQAGRRVRRRAAQGRASSTSPARTPTHPRTSRGSCRSGGPTCSAPRARATSTSSSTCSAPTRSLRATETPRGRRARAT